MGKKNIFAVAAIVVVFTIIGTLYWFYTPGIHLIGPFGHINLTQECYLFDAEGQESGTTVVSIKGDVRREFWDFRQGTFAGVITVGDEEQNKGEQGSYQHVFYCNDDGSYYILYLPNRFAYDETEQRLYPSMDGDRYEVYLDADDAFGLVAFNEQDEVREHRFTAICADSQNDAASYYEQTKEAGLIP